VTVDADDGVGNDAVVDRKKRKAKAKAASARPSPRRHTERVTKLESSQDALLEGRDAGTRDRMVEGAALLLGRRGLQGTSFSEVLEATGSPRGSVYHHFPGGKDQLVKAALDWAAAYMARAMDPSEGAPAEEITDLFLQTWRGILARSGFRSGCAAVAVTVATESPELLEHTSAIFRAWRDRLAELLVKGGLPSREAVEFAAFLLAASEGAVVLSRGEQSMQPFDLVAAQLLKTVRGLTRKREEPR